MSAGETNPQAAVGDPTWEIAHLFPKQGSWSEAEYLALDSTRMVELSDGWLEVLPMPTIAHQMLVKYLFVKVDAFVTNGSLGRVLFAPLPVRLWPGTYREPDIVFLSTERDTGTEDYPEGADLVVEVVSDSRKARHRDLNVKPAEYLRVGVAEYWIVDPEQHEVHVLSLHNDEYRQQVYGSGAIAASILLDGFTVEVDPLFAAGRQ